MRQRWKHRRRPATESADHQLHPTDLADRILFGVNHYSECDRDLRTDSHLLGGLCQHGKGTVSGNTLTVTGAGKIVVDANQAGNASYYAAPQVSVTIVVNPAGLTITWPTPAAITYGAALSGTQLDATASGPAALSTLLPRAPCPKRERRRCP